MESGDEDQVTDWLALLKAGDLEAAQPLWERYFERLARRVERRLPAVDAGESEDIALSAFNSFCLGAARGRFPRLNDRHDLWRLLLFISAQKIADHRQRREAVKRGGRSAVEGDAALARIIGREPSPELAVSVADELQHLLARLGDETLRRIALWKMEGYTNREISDCLGCALRTVANKLELIRKTLRAE